MNQIEASLLRKWKSSDIKDDPTHWLYQYVGTKELHDDTGLGVSIVPKFSRQSCKDLFISIKFRGQFMTWKDMPTNKSFEEDFKSAGPHYYPTDFGACCLFVPHLDFQAVKGNQTYDEIYSELIADAENGESNGLQLLLDAEHFNYGHIKSSDSVGFKIALHLHSDKPMMQFSSQLITAGTDNHINVMPTVSYTTDAAISMMDSGERNCYAREEARLTYLPTSSGFKYSLNNCIINEVIRHIIWCCRCIPAFTSLWIQEKYYDPENGLLDVCNGETLQCANQRMQSIDGVGKITNCDLTSKLLNGLENPHKIGNISKPPSVKCMQACNLQENANQISLALYPQQYNFFYQRNFCLLASHLLQATCKEENRRYFLDLRQPDLCKTLESFENYFGTNSYCENWPGSFLDDNEIPDTILIDQLFQYGRENLAMVRVMMQSPYVTKIKRDVAMTFINYVASTGGLLGLFLGFSFISAIEMLFWICCCCREVKRKVAN